MSKYIPVAEMTPEAVAIKHAKVNARNAKNITEKPDLVAERKRRKKLYRSNLKFSNPEAYQNSLASKNTTQPRRRAMKKA